MTDDTVQICCSRCRTKFRDSAGRLRGGYSRQCPSCECVIFFEEDSPNKDVRQALRTAEAVRKARRTAEREKAASRAAAAAAAAHIGDDEPESPSPGFGRRLERRGLATGRRWR